MIEFPRGRFFQLKIVAALGKVFTIDNLKKQGEK